jgi:dethiobiotin synthetase
LRGLFVTGTDTGVGKTIVSACLLAAMVAAGERPRAHKPVVTGLDELDAQTGPGGWPADHELLAFVAGMSPEEVSPLRYGPAVSPHLAAELAGELIDPRQLLIQAREAAGDSKNPRTVIVEGVGGLLVPLTAGYTVCDFAVELALPTLIASRPGLGTINHTLLTLRCARAAGLDVRAVVLTPWPRKPSPMEISNRETIARIGDIEVQTLSQVSGPDPALLARAGAGLPWKRWL